MQPLLLFTLLPILALALPYDGLDNFKRVIVSAIEQPIHPQSEKVDGDERSYVLQTPATILRTRRIPTWSF
jgi:hypothetical protein